MPEVINTLDGLAATLIQERLFILAAYDDLAALQAAHATGSEGDAYMADDHLYIWDMDVAAWVDVGTLHGMPCYVHNRWSSVADPTDEQISTEPAAYMGVYTGASSTAPTAASSYSWGRWQGEVGPKGEKGDSGLQGPKGDTGDIGPQGVEGLKGDTGETGPQGATGAGGVQGPQGIAGADGAIGPTGPTGPYFTPTVSSGGIITWSNNGNLTNPTSIDITQALTEGLQNLGTLTGSVTINCALGNYGYATIGAAVTLSLTAAASGRLRVLTLELTNGGAYTVTWPTSITWQDGTAPTLTASGVDIVNLITRDNGVTWRGVLVGQAFA